MGNYAIVGGAGFIGSHFVDELANRNHQILVIDNFCSGSEERVEDHLGKPYFELANINAEDTASLTDAFKDIETVIHLASNPDIAKAALEPRIDFIQGTSLTESVLEASRMAKVKRILYASGSGVYKANGLDPISEDSRLQAISTYGASKLAGEALLSSYNFMFGIKTIAFRFANVVGPKQTHGVGYDFMRKLKSNQESLTVLGDGSQTKSYINVSDVVNAVLLAESKISSEFEAFNVSTLDYISVAEIAELAILVSGLNRDEVKIEFGSSDRGWKADVPKIFLDSTKIRSLGWESKMTSREAIYSSLVSMTR